MIISLEQYAGPWAGHEDWTPERQRNGTILLKSVNALIKDYEANTGKTLAINPITKSHVSGAKYGGFRPLDCEVGARLSSHKEAKAVDLMDKDEAFDKWLTANPEKLVEHNLYREHPDATKGWCHLSTKAPRSGNRTFKP
jgi:hypothetical protein